MSHNHLTIRATTGSDRAALRNLTALGSRHYLSGRGLVAEIDGEPIAAISLTSGAVMADLDRADHRLFHSLRRLRYQILRQGGDVGRAVNLLRRLAPARHAPQENTI
jgi:hypothetical protein